MSNDCGIQTGIVFDDIFERLHDGAHILDQYLDFGREENLQIGAKFIYLRAAERLQFDCFFFGNLGVVAFSKIDPFFLQLS